MLAAGIVFFVAAILLASCAAEPKRKAVSQSSVPTPSSVSSTSVQIWAMVYRRQGEVLREVAQRLEAEAALYQLKLGADHERTRQSRESAIATWAAAEEADEIARTYEQLLRELEYAGGERSHLVK